MANWLQAKKVGHYGTKPSATQRQIACRSNRIVANRGNAGAAAGGTLLNLSLVGVGGQGVPATGAPLGVAVAEHRLDNDG